MRWYILRTLLHKEFLRHGANRGGVTLAGLLVAASLLLSVLNPGTGSGADDRGTSSFFGGIHHCFIYHHPEANAGDDGWIDHLKANIPPELAKQFIFREFARFDVPRNRGFGYDTGVAAIEIWREDGSTPQRPHFTVQVRYPKGDRTGMAAYEMWFWKETYRWQHQKVLRSFQSAGVSPALVPPLSQLDTDVWMYGQISRDFDGHLRDAIKGSPAAPAILKSVPELSVEESPLTGAVLDMRAAMATSLVMFALFFTCVYLMPSLTCEEHERGLLLAQVLSPASTWEILAARFIFYPGFGIFLAVILAGIHNPVVLSKPFFWCSLLTLAAGSLGIGMSVASLAKSQRSASMGALCYMLAIALLLLICQQNNIGLIPWLMVEYHAPQILHAALTNQDRPELWLNLAVSAGLAAVWLVVAAYLFRKRGWQ